ncbi:MAG: 30S ribosome-binding factor RbfA [Candidatus Omnitrophica bacterium]|nr:30S ribosome-binding factor RbfA [Candidatus Omnitrophota bacterium]
MEKLNQLFKREIGNMILLGEVSDPRIRLVTITYVDISKDLSWAHVGFSLLADDPRAVQSAEAGLDSARRRVRKLLSERVDIRHMPEIKFVYDKTIAESFRMSQTLEGIRREREGREAGGSGKDQQESAMSEEE